MLDSASLHCRFTPTWPSAPQSCRNFLLPTSYTAFYKLLSPCSLDSAKFHPSHFSFSPVHGLGRIGFPVFALKKPGKGGVGLGEQSDSDVEFDEFFDEDDADFQDEDEDEMLLPLKNMREWLAARPRGFGEGKEYDTSIEDELLQEIEQSRTAQAANINKLKNMSTSEPNSGRNVAEIKGQSQSSSIYNSLCSCPMGEAFTQID